MPDVPFRASPLPMNEEIVFFLVDPKESLSEATKRLSESLLVLQKNDEDGNTRRLLIVFPERWGGQSTVRARGEFFAKIDPLGQRVILFCHERVLSLSAENHACMILKEKGELRTLLHDHPQAEKILQHISFTQWQEWLSLSLLRLRSFSVHRLSVLLILFASIALFGTVLTVAIPSAHIHIRPTVTLVSYTANIVLAASGVTLEYEPKNVLPLITLHSSVQKSMTFSEISKKFLGENAETEMTFINESQEPYSFRAGTRLVNQAGMIFKTLAPIDVPSASGLESGLLRVKARAAPEDLYGQITGERGNVPAGLKWEIPGLPLEERAFVYARNMEAATGGVTKYGKELQTQDLELARKQLEQELLSTALMKTDEELQRRQEEEEKTYILLQYDVLTNMSFSGFVLPTDRIGQEVDSIPIEGALSYHALAYEKNALLGLLLPRLLEHVEEGRELIQESVTPESTSVHVIEYDDNLRWVKITAELSGKQRSILEQTSRPGRAFTEKVREMIRGKSVAEAERIIQNFPEVERVEIDLWPPWRDSLPSLSTHIMIDPENP